MKVLGLSINWIDNKSHPIQSKEHEKKTAEKAITKRQIFEVFNDIAKLRNAFDLANSFTNYNREDLHEIYRQIVRDPHLQSQWTTRKLKTKQREFKVIDSSDNENDELTALLQSEWFLMFVDNALDSMMWGFSLIQFGPWRNGSFHRFRLDEEIKDPVYAADRDFVKPELGLVVDNSGANEGVTFWDDNFWTVFVGKSHDLGLLEKLSELILIKHNAIRNWSEWGEVFGMDTRIVKTDKKDEPRRALLKALENLGTNGIGVFSPEDELEYVGTSKSDAFKVYNELIRYVDEQISKVLFGQDVVSNNTGQVVGKTGENIAKLYGNADANFMKAIVNDLLFPFLTRIKVANFEGFKFVYDTTEELTLIERSEIDLKISQMGKEHSDEYINDTYGTEVEASADGAAELANQIKNLYKT